MRTFYFNDLFVCAMEQTVNPHRPAEQPVRTGQHVRKREERKEAFPFLVLNCFGRSYDIFCFFSNTLEQTFIKKIILVSQEILFFSWAYRQYQGELCIIDQMGCLSKHSFSAAPYKATIHPDLPLFRGPGFSSTSILIMALKTCESAKPYSLKQI